MVAFLALDIVNTVITDSTYLVNRNTGFNLNTFIMENRWPYIVYNDDVNKYPSTQ